MRYRDRFSIVFNDLKTVAPAQVAESAARLGLSFPDGYAEYVTELGEGVPRRPRAFHPDRPDELFAPPRHDDGVLQIGPGLATAIQRPVDSGVATRPNPLRHFEPIDELKARGSSNVLQRLLARIKRRGNSR